MRGLLRYRLFLAIVAFDLLVLAFRPATGITLFGHSWRVLAQMLGLLPPVFLFLGLLDVWVPRETVMRFVGERSGVLGMALSIVLGAAAAGPLYGAFPIAEAMARKGARYLNILIFLGAWSTLKVPMFLFEFSALGPRFAVTRWAVNVVGIIGMAYLIDRLMSPAEKAILGSGTAGGGRAERTRS
ncbi:MAG: permease [Bacillota bacterium]|nr:permease [Bacillota bacterium]